ncbi:MAG: NAD-dependent epimerase/dehydratase family protein [bacterium]|nr:NAD-dependent epimerase/dehydratase family protein [bacterium]
MARVLITGAQGFLGSNLAWWFRSRQIQADFQKQAIDPVELLFYTRQNQPEELAALVAQADFVYHLAGVNRPETDQEFDQVNRGLTAELITELEKRGQAAPPILFASSTQAERDNLYGLSKRAAEKELEDYAERTGNRVLIYRLTNLFGKWCRPHYNSAVATFCHQISRSLPITLNDPQVNLSLLYIDDVCSEFCARLFEPGPRRDIHREAGPCHQIKLGKLAETLLGFKSSRENLLLPDFADPLMGKLYATYISYLPPDQFAYSLAQHEDRRGHLAEIVKSEHAGQIFISTTKPGITRGNHFHHTKVEKFCVVYGEAVVQFRQIDGEEIFEYPVSGAQVQVVDIPPGYTHRITNTGPGDLVTLFWSDQIFNAEAPDTFFLEL